MKIEFKSLLSKFTDCKALVACLSLGFLVRLIPELLAFPLPIGFDTVDYAFVMKTGVIWPHWSAFFTTTWLLYAMLVPLYGLLQADPFLVLKFIAPLLFGINTAGIYWFARKTLRWKLGISLVASVFFTLQLASLRISWDLLRNTLGLGILLFTLSYVDEVKSKHGFAIFVFLSTLSVFAHEYAAVILLAVVISLALWRARKTGFGTDVKRLLLSSLPAFTIFVIGMYLTFFPIHTPAETSIIAAGDTAAAKQAGLFFIVDYLSIKSSVDSYAGYSALALNVTLLFAVLYLPYLYLVIKGFFHDRILNSWTLLTIIGAFGCLATPFFALQYWHRWMFMLVYPFTFYATKALGAAFHKSLSRKISSPFSFLDKKTAGMLLATFSLAGAYLATPAIMSYSGTSLPSISGTYLYFSTNPTVPYQDVACLVEAMNWLNLNMDSGSSVVLQHAFSYWGRLYLDPSHAIIYFENDIDLAVQTAQSNSFNQTFFVWWNEPIGWYGVSVPQNFISVKTFGRITVFNCGGPNIG